MKKKFSFAILFAAIALLTAAIVYAFDTPVAVTACAVTGANVAFYSLTALGIINTPAGALGAYIGAPGGQTTKGEGVQVISGERARAAYMTYYTNPEYKDKEITPSFLRFEAVLVNGQSKIVFKHYVGDGVSNTPTERRLERNDKFAITDIGFYLLRQADGKTGGDLITFADAQVFGASAPDLAAIFDGNLKMNIQRKDVLPFFDLKRFWKVPQTQKSAAGNRSQFSLKESMIKLTPHIDLDGMATNDIVVEFPSYAGWAGQTADAGFKHYAVLYMHGLLINNGSANI